MVWSTLESRTAKEQNRTEVINEIFYKRTQRSTNEGGAMVGHRTYDQALASSTPDHDAAA